jgi:DNA-directed RNA polymerase subunit L
MFMQWVPAYQMSQRDVKTIMHTVRSVFPHTTAWTSGSIGEIILLSRKSSKLTISYAQLLERVRRQSVYSDIHRLGYDPELLPLRTFLMNEREVKLYLYSTLEKPLRKNSDDYLITEYSTPRNLLRQSAVQRFNSIQSLQGNIDKLLAITKKEDLGYLLERMEEHIE